MPIDASIPLGIRTPQFDSPLETFGKVEQLKGLRAQGQMRDMQMQEFADKRSREQARRGILSKGLQGEELANELERGGYLDDATTYRKSIDERQDGRLKREGEIVKLYGELSRAVLANPTEQSAIAAIERIEQATGRKMDAERGQIYSLRGDPEGIRRMAAGAALEADKLLGQFKEMDVGGARVGGLVDPLSGQFNETFRREKTLTPDAVLTDERTRSEGAANRGVTVRGQNMTDSRARELATATREQGGKPPAGYRWSADGQRYEAIPGGPADIKAGIEGDKRQKTIAAMNTKSDTIINAVDEALNQTGFTSTGLTGAVLSKVPGTGAYDLDRTVETIKANLGFAELQAMRDASPTGGALGAIAVQELIALQSTLANLDVGQSEPQQVANLKKVKKHYQALKDAINQGASSNGGASGAWDKVETDELPDPAQYNGAVMTDSQTGIRYQSNGKNWVRAK